MDRAKDSITDPARDINLKAGRRNYHSRKARGKGHSGKGVVREHKKPHSRRA